MPPNAEAIALTSEEEVPLDCLSYYEHTALAGDY